jgi:hypothetical protein
MSGQKMKKDWVIINYEMTTFTHFPFPELTCLKECLTTHYLQNGTQQVNLSIMKIKLLLGML